MAGKQPKEKFQLPKKTYWQLYSLQALESEKLARIVNKILKRDYMLVK